uniref:Serpentine receptor class gamma n=1 Tax=Panagrellus redivivus TaxID=6233 RepID=A0A7E4VDW8_PANRE
MVEPGFEKGVMRVIICTIVTAPFWFFQVSVITFLIHSRRKKYESYTTTFFLLFIMLSITDTISQINNFMGQRIIEFPYIRQFVISSSTYSSIIYLCTAYLLYTQCFFHFSIAINRIWSVYSMLTPVSKRLNNIGKTAIFIIPLLPLPFLLPRFFFTAIYFVNNDDTLSLKYTDTGIQKYQSTVATCIIFFTAMPTFVIELITVRKYQKLLKTHTVNVKKCTQEYRLLWQALFSLIIQVLVCIFQIMIYVSTLVGNTTLFAMIMSLYSYNADLLNLTGSVSLIVVSSHVRKDYIRFWLNVFGKCQTETHSTSGKSLTTRVSVIKVSK